MNDHVLLMMSLLAVVGVVGRALRYVGSPLAWKLFWGLVTNGVFASLLAIHSTYW